MEGTIACKASKRIRLPEAAKREEKWRKNGYTVISMKNDFKTIYGDGVVKTEFSFQ